MRITFLGTKGEIEEWSRIHKKHSAIVVEYRNTRLLIDYGERLGPILNRVKPTHILLTHAHKDHSFGFLDEKEEGIDVYMLQRVWDSLEPKVKEKLDHKHLYMNSWQRLGDLEVYAFPVSHSINYPANGFKIRNDSTICYVPDVLSITNRKLILRDVDVYIGDGAYITDRPGRVRRHKGTGRPFGHALIRDQVRWCAESDVKTIIFTHFGKEPVENPDKLRKHFTELEKEFNVKIIEAKDGMTIDTKRLGTPGIYLVPPHARMIAEKKKTLIVSSRTAPKQYLNVPLHFIEADKSYGLIKITNVRGPLDANFVRKHLRDRHQVTDKEWKEWWANIPRVYVYEFEIVHVWDEPVPVEVPRGVQKWIRSVKILLERRKPELIQEKILELFKYVKEKVDLRQFTDSVWLRDEEWYGKKVCPTREHEFLMVLSWAHRPDEQQLAMYHKVRAHYEKLGKKFHQLTESEIKEFPYQVEWQFRFLKNTVSYLKATGQTFSEFSEKLLDLTPLEIRRILMDVVGAKTSSKIVECFMRDYLKVKAFPIDFRVEAVLKKFGIPIDSELIISYCSMLDISPKVLNRALYSVSERLLIKPVDVKKVIEKPELVKEFSDEKLWDDHRICHMWAGQNWKTLPKELTKEEVKKFHDLLAKEMERRGFDHRTPIELEGIDSVVSERTEPSILQGELQQSIDDIGRAAKQPSPYAPIHRYGEKLGRKIDIEEILRSYEKPIILKRGYIKLVGGLANWGETEGDIDLFIGDVEYTPSIHQPVIFRLGRALPPDISERAQYHFSGDYGLPFTSYVDLYDLVLMPAETRSLIRLEEYAPRIKILRDEQAKKEAQKSYEEDAVKPLRFVVPLKGYRASYRFADLVPEVVETWFKREVYPIYAQKKYDGIRLLLMKDENKVVIRTDDGEDVTKRFPSIVKLSQKILPRTCTIDIEAELWREKKHLPREEAAGYAHAKTPPDDSGFVFNVFDIIYFYDPKFEHHELPGDVGDLHKEPYELRLRYLKLIDWPQSTDDIPKTPSFNLTPTITADNPNELIKAIKKLSEAIASEGAVVKSSKHYYELDGLTEHWLKFKKMAEIHAIVLKSIETKTKGVFNLLLGVRVPAGWKIPEKHLAEIDGKKYVVIGKTFNVKGYKRPGTIITVSFHTLNHYIDTETGEQWIKIYEPKFIEIRPTQKTPDSATEAIKIAHDKELLTIKRLAISRLPMDDKPHEAVMQHHYRDEFENLLPKDIGEPGSPWYEKALDELITQLYESGLLRRVALGRSVHIDLRIKVDDHLEGFTIMDAKPGAIKEPVTSVQQAKQLEKDWDKYFKITNDPQTYIVSPRRKLWVELKKPEPVEWLTVERVVEPGEIGATKYEFGVFSIIDRPIVYFGTIKPDFCEMFLYGKRFTGRWVVRLLPNPWIREMPGRRFVLLMWKPEDQTPYVLTRRAVRKKWIPPKGVSCLPPEIRQQIPSEYRYWKFDAKSKRIETRDALVTAIRKGEVRIRPVEIIRKKAEEPSQSKSEGD